MKSPVFASLPDQVGNIVKGELMDRDKVGVGLRVKTKKLRGTSGMTTRKKHLVVRKEGIEGIVKDVVPGHNWEVWLVKHNDSEDVGAYYSDEFKPVR